MVPDLSNHHPEKSEDARKQYRVLMRRARTKLDAARTSSGNLRREYLVAGYGNYGAAQQINDAVFFAFGSLIEDIVDFRLVEVRQLELKPDWARGTRWKISPDYRERMAEFLQRNYPDFIEGFDLIVGGLEAVPVVRDLAELPGAMIPPM